MTAYTVHSVRWQAAAPLLLELRKAAICAAPALDFLDAQCRHALALSAQGRAIACARLTPSGVIERIIILPDEPREWLTAALIEVLHAD